MSTYQHSCTQVKLLEELGDKQMDSDKIVDVFLFHLFDDVCQPFKVLLSPCYPDEVDLRKNWEKLKTQ